MIRFSAAFLLILTFTCGIVKAQYNTGSDDLNQSLIEIDSEASVDFGDFKAKLSGSYDITNGKIDHLSMNVGMSAGDIYMTVRIAKIASVEIDQVVQAYRTHGSKGWGVTAKQLGIKPGSPEFHALKGSQNNNSKGKSNNKKGRRDSIQ